MSKHKQNMQRRLSMGKGAALGGGHKGHSNLPPLQELPMPPELALGMAPGTKRYLLGQCSVIVSPPYLSRGWHVSIAHRSRYPTWDEIAKAWYDAVPDSAHRIACMVLPKKADYVNYHDFCFQLHELQQTDDGLVTLTGGV